MDPEQLEEIKRNLLKMRSDLLHGMRNSQQASIELGNDGVPDIGDMSVTAYSRDVLFNLGEAQRRQIKDIDAALERMEKGEYAICQRCEEEIAPRRMKVRPFSRYCVECKEDVEKFGE